MSQLYKLFCEGLKSRSVEEGLSSTIIVTSTPLEDDDDVGFIREPPQVLKPLHNVGSDGQSRLSPDNLSVQGQVGSASESTEASAPGAPVTNDVSKPPSQQTTLKQQQFSQKKCNFVGESKSPKSSYMHPKSRFVNVSPVDFVDRIIAAKNLDKDVARLCGHSNNSSSSTESEPSDVQSTPRKRTPVSDSSETDFEGADEVCINSHKSGMSLGPKLTYSGMKRLKENSHISKSTCSGSDINLVLENAIFTPTIQSHTSAEIECGSPSAARCRVFYKSRTNADLHSEGSCTNSNLLQNLTPHQGNVPNSNSVNLSAILNGVVAYVEVRSGHDNRSMGVRTQLRNLGATVVEKMSKEVTHVVFNEGSPTTLRLAREQNCHLVSVLWIDECKKLRRVAPEDEHPPLNLHIYEQLENPQKYRKMKSLQPDFEEGKGEERLNRYIKKYRSKIQQALQSQDNEKTSSDESDNEHQTNDEKKKLQNSLLPNGIVLKELSVVLNKINTVSAAGKNVTSEQKQKRRLMPLQQVQLSEPFDNLDSEEYVCPENPYNVCPLTRKQKTTSSTKRIMKKTCTSRRSSCFVYSTQSSMQSQFRQRKMKPQMRTMVCTFMHRRDIDVVAAVIKQLGGWILEPTVSPKTTHVVCGESKRTINLLRGIAYGCWILHQEWVLRSLEAGYWLDEEPFELNEFPAIQQCRVARETLGVSPDIFSSAAAIFVSKDTTPPHSDLIDLLKLCGAHIVNSARQAKVIIGPYLRRSSFTNVVFVKENWVLDSIQENMLQPLKRYNH